MSCEIDHTLVIGAAGQMTSAVVRAICAADPAVHLTLADRDEAGLERLAHECGGTRVTTRCLDLFDGAALRRALEDVDFVIHGAGPFHETAGPVMRACIEAGASYMDIDDDVESTLEALTLDAPAREANVALYVGHGASPGLSNVLGLDLLQRLDEAQELEVAWCVGEDPEAPLGRAVIEHTLHIGAGRYTGYRGGELQPCESFVESALFPMAAPLGSYRLYECAHPEPVMFGRTHPGLRDVTCWGGLYPQPLNGALRGIARAVRDGRLRQDEATAFLQMAAPSNGQRAGRPPATSLGGLVRSTRFALGGMAEQLASGRASPRDMRPMLALGRRSRRPVVAGIGARARGLRAGRRRELVASVDVRAPAHGGGAMASLTGACEAIFFELAGRRASSAATGVLFPQSWVRPETFYSALSQRLSDAGGSFRVHVEEH